MMPPKNKQAGMMKRYHISDFKNPYTPDVELQELPNSVVLDFVDGSGLQIACEDRAGQMNILHSKFFFLPVKLWKTSSFANMPQQFFAKLIKVMHTNWIYWLGCRSSQRAPSLH